MAISVKHDKRREEILKSALDVFVETGYANATFQKIADKCGITRTILYLYFKNKRDIFMASIKVFTDKLESEIRAVAAKPDKPENTLAAVAMLVLSRCMEQSHLLSVIVNYLAHAKKNGIDIQKRIRRRTIRMRHIISGIVISGQKNGQLKKIPVGTVSDFYFCLAESAILRATVMGTNDFADLSDVMLAFFDGLRA